MRIVFLSYNYSPDIHSPKEWIDRIKFYVGWLECLAKEHTVIRVDQVNYEGDFTHNDVQYYCVNDGRKKNYFPKKLHGFVKSLQPDVVVVSSFLFPLQLIQLRHSMGNKVKLIVQHHAEKPFTGIKKRVQQMASRRIDAGIFASKDIGTEWVQKGNLHPGIKLFEIVGGSSVFHPIVKETAKQKTQIAGSTVFLWVGRLNQNKDPLTAIKAFLKFTEMEPAARLYMIYHTADLLPEINKLFVEKVGNNPVMLIGKIQHSELLYWYNSADFFLSASHYEGSGTALCEAMSCGCIPIVSNIPSFRMINGNCGLLFEPGNEQSLFSSLQHAMQLNVEEKRNEALHHFKTELSFEAIAAKFQQLLASL